MEIAETIREYGEWFYAITFVWTFLEGETFVLFAGLAARQGILRLDLLIAFAWLGSFCGDQLYFWIGRRWGDALLRRFPRWSPGVHAALDLLRRYNTWFILSFRFIYGVRNFSSFAMGTSGLPWPRFLVLNFIAAGIWAVTFAGTGYIVGATFEHLLDDLALAFGVVMLTIFVTVITMIARARKRRLHTPPLNAAPIPVRVEKDGRG
ncbi:MAG: DedA family protein [Alphaproteobacteria bacterium]|nr:DedA family protein [Alphaproteobacteria bacterium]